MNTIPSRFKALGYVPPFVAKSTMVMDAADILVLGTGNAEAATLLADALNEACREEAGDGIGNHPEGRVYAFDGSAHCKACGKTWDLGTVPPSCTAAPVAGQWVKCSERLPDHGDLIWCCGASHKPRVARLVSNQHGLAYRYANGAECPTDYITHWMPCPTPQPPTTQPKEERR